MYIEDKYWNNYIGDTDDSLTLVDYLAERGQAEIAFREILADFGLDRLQGQFRRPEVPLVYTDPAGWEQEIHFAIDLVTDLAALLLECRISGSVDLEELYGAPVETAASQVRLTATEEDHALLDRVLEDFIADPMAYDLSDLCSQEEMEETAAVVKALRQELYG